MASLPTALRNFSCPFDQHDLLLEPVKIELIIKNVFKRNTSDS